jgi:hypothetical protein
MGPSRARTDRLIESTRPNRWFIRLAEVLELNHLAAETILDDLLTSTDAAPATMTKTDIIAMRDGVLEIIEAIFPAGDRPTACARLEELLDE